MRVVGIRKIEKFYKRHAAAKGPLLAWLDEAKNASWVQPQDIKNRYAHASFLSNNRCIFNTGGNKFRLEVKVAYSSGGMLIIDVSTHAEYDKKNKKRR